MHLLEQTVWGQRQLLQNCKVKGRKCKNSVKNPSQWFSKMALAKGNCFGRNSSLISEKAMAHHSSTLAWKIPWTEEPGGLQSMGSLRVGGRLSDFTFPFHFHALEKEMATHSSVLAWRIPGTEKPGGLPSMGSHWVGHRDLAAAAANLINEVILPWEQYFTKNFEHICRVLRSWSPT